MQITTNNELLAVVSALRPFRPYLQWASFRLRNNHASLTWLFNLKSPEGQVARRIEALQEYNFTIEHLAGCRRGNADALSRRPCTEQSCKHRARQDEREQPESETENMNVLKAALVLPTATRGAGDGRSSEKGEGLANEGHTGLRSRGRGLSLAYKSPQYNNQQLFLFSQLWIMFHV